MTEAQVQDYINALDFIITLDDKVVSGFEISPIEPYSGPLPPEFPEDENVFAVYWRKNIGPLSLGSHSASFVRVLDKTVFDGVSTYEAGEWQSGCEIIVK